MRATAAFVVMFRHITGEGVNFYGLNKEKGFVHFVYVTNPFVDLFFITSGFIITHITMRETSPRIFFSKRIARIVPTYWFYTTLTLIAAFVIGTYKRGNEKDFLYIISSYLFIPAANSKGHIFPFLEIGWTLNYEMFFYFIFVLSLFIKKRNTGVLALLFFIVFSSLAGYYIPEKYTALKFWSDPIILEFGYGIILAILYDKGIRISVAWKWIMMVAAIMFDCVVILFLSKYINDYRFFLLGIPMTVFFAAMALEEKNSKHSKLYMWMFGIGLSSYSLYLAHPFILRSVTVVFLKLRWATPTAWVFAAILMFTLAVVVSKLSYKYIEMPSQKKVRQWLKVK
jgi:peptidoglycan/LPS O-acetylase OafA/YrhL